jgi:hypothetical protein
MTVSMSWVNVTVVSRNSSRDSDVSKVVWNMVGHGDRWSNWTGVMAWPISGSISSENAGKGGQDKKDLRMRI